MCFPQRELGTRVLFWTEACWNEAFHVVARLAGAAVRAMRVNPIEGIRIE